MEAPERFSVLYDEDDSNHVPAQNGSNSPALPRPAKIALYQGKKIHRYKLNIQNEVHFLNRKINENHQEIIWEVTYHPLPGQVTITEVANTPIKQDGQLKEFMQIISIINRPAHKLDLQLNGNGAITAVLNNEALTAEWERLKYAELQPHILSTPWLEEVVKGYDLEYGNMQQSLKKNMLYNLFFVPYGEMMCPVTRYKLAERRQILSQIFGPHFIRHDLYYSAEEAEKGLEVRLQSQIDRNFCQGEFTADFKERYATITELPLHYDFSLEARYHFGPDGLMAGCKAYLKEQANAHFIYTAQYTITLTQ